uniref:Uncharacterized protein n=1 Tax=Octopus bimaculoides TaxID=37653 RepID=A0A0L8G7Z0_OCTBM
MMMMMIYIFRVFSVKKRKRKRTIKYYMHDQEFCKKLKKSLVTSHEPLCPWSSNPSPGWEIIFDHPCLSLEACHFLLNY